MKTLSNYLLSSKDNPMVEDSLDFTINLSCIKTCNMREVKKNNQNRVGEGAGAGAGACLRNHKQRGAEEG